MKQVLTVVALLTASLLPVAHSQAAGSKVEINDHHFAFDGPFGTFDNSQLQRGFQVFEQVCAACHSLKYFSFRELEGIGFNEEQIKAIIAAGQYQVMGEPDDQGEVALRPARLSDRWPSPYANDKAAAAVFGKAPPDLSLMAKAREGGPDYLYSLLTGYVDNPSKELLEEYHVTTFDPTLQHFNKAFEGHVIAMAQPLRGEDVSYVDGTAATLEQEAADVSAFLTYVADPHLATRKKMGVRVIAFLLVFTALSYFMFVNAARRAKARQKKFGGPWHA